MPEKRSKHMIRQCFYGKDSDESDDERGYRRLDNPRVAECGVSSSRQRHPQVHFLGCPVQNSTGKQSISNNTKTGYNEVDAKGKRLRKKLRRKQMRKRIAHALHSSWKWVKRGAAASAPNMAAMFMFAPTPVFTFGAASSSRRT